MNDLTAITFSGRCFSPDELTLIRQATIDYAALGITEIARTICEWLDWQRPTGRLKNHECRLLLERLEHQGVLTLPALRRSGRRGPRSVGTDTRSDCQIPIQCRLADLQPLRLTLIEESQSALWRQYIQRYHYLGCRVPVGAHLRYFVYSAQGQVLACLLWTSPAWTMAPRDRWIGWSAPQRVRQRNRFAMDPFGFFRRYCMGSPIVAASTLFHGQHPLRDDTSFSTSLQRKMHATRL